MPEHLVQSEIETANLAAMIAGSAQEGDIFLLHGPLGAGKSVFARSFIRALCGPETNVPSPTFTLLQTYESRKAPIYHFDLYRLQSPEEIFEIGWEDALSAITLVEWPERLGPHLPDHARMIVIEPTGQNTRRIWIDEKNP